MKLAASLKGHLDAGAADALRLGIVAEPAGDSAVEAQSALRRKSIVCVHTWMSPGGGEL